MPTDDRVYAAPYAQDTKCSVANSSLLSYLYKSKRVQDACQSGLKVDASRTTASRCTAYPVAATASAPLPYHHVGASMGIASEATWDDWDEMDGVSSVAANEAVASALPSCQDTPRKIFEPKLNTRKPDAISEDDHDHVSSLVPVEKQVEEVRRRIKEQLSVLKEVNRTSKEVDRVSREVRSLNSTFQTVQVASQACRRLEEAKTLPFAALSRPHHSSAASASHLIPPEAVVKPIPLFTSSAAASPLYADHFSSEESPLLTQGLAMNFPRIVPLPPPPPAALAPSDRLKLLSATSTESVSSPRHHTKTVYIPANPPSAVASVSHLSTNIEPEDHRSTKKTSTYSSDFNTRPTSTVISSFSAASTDSSLQDGHDETSVEDADGTSETVLTETEDTVLMEATTATGSVMTDYIDSETIDEVSTIVSKGDRGGKASVGHSVNDVERAIEFLRQAADFLSTQKGSQLMMETAAAISKTASRTDGVGSRSVGEGAADVALRKTISSSLSYSFSSSSTSAPSPHSWISSVANENGVPTEKQGITVPNDEMIVKRLRGFINKLVTTVKGIDDRRRRIGERKKKMLLKARHLSAAWKALRDNPSARLSDVTDDVSDLLSVVDHFGTKRRDSDEEASIVDEFSVSGGASSRASGSSVAVEDWLLGDMDDTAGNVEDDVAIEDEIDGNSDQLRGSTRSSMLSVESLMELNLEEEELAEQLLVEVEDETLSPSGAVLHLLSRPGFLDTTESSISTLEVLEDHHLPHDSSNTSIVQEEEGAFGRMSNESDADGEGDSVAPPSTILSVSPSSSSADSNDSSRINSIREDVERTKHRRRAALKESTVLPFSYLYNPRVERQAFIASDESGSYERPSGQETCETPLKEDHAALAVNHSSSVGPAANNHKASDTHCRCDNGPSPIKLRDWVGSWKETEKRTIRSQFAAYCHHQGSAKRTDDEGNETSH